MNEDVIVDLKQFIATTVSQQLAEQDKRFDAKIDALDQKVDAKLGALDSKLSGKIDDLTEFVTEAIDTSNETAGKQLADHERRLSKFEHAAA